MFKKADLSDYDTEVLYILTYEGRGKRRYYLANDGALYLTPEDAFASGSTLCTHVLYGVTFQKTDMHSQEYEAITRPEYEFETFKGFKETLDTLREVGDMFDA